MDKSAPTAGVKALAPVQGDEGFIVSWVGQGTVSRIVSYDVQVSANGGAVAGLALGDKATSDVFLGRTAAGYAFRVRARDSRRDMSARWNVVSTWSATPVDHGRRVRRG